MHKALVFHPFPPPSPHPPSPIHRPPRRCTGLSLPSFPPCQPSPPPLPFTPSNPPPPPPSPLSPSPPLPYTQASQEVHKALALDYVASPEEQVRFQLERPLDRYLEPLHTALALRTSLTMEPANAEEEAVLLVERSKEVGWGGGGWRGEGGGSEWQVGEARGEEAVLLLEKSKEVG